MIENITITRYVCDYCPNSVQKDGRDPDPPLGWRVAGNKHFCTTDCNERYQKQKLPEN